MTGGQAQYGALAAKVKALYGKRLRLEDFQHMAAFKSEAEVLEYLRAHPSWSRASGVLSTAAKAAKGGRRINRRPPSDCRKTYFIGKNSKS